MPKNRQNQDNRSIPLRGVAIVLVLVILAYWLIFFSQASIRGFRGEDGSPLSRWVDLSMLLLVDELVAGMSGNGRLEMGVLDRIPIAFAGTVYLGLGCWIGCAFVLITGLVRRLSRLEVFALSTISGLAMLSTATLLVGLFGGLQTRWPLIITFTALAFISLWVQQRWKRSESQDELREERSNSQPAEPIAEPVDSSSPFAIPSRALPPTTLGSLWLQRLLPVAVIGMAMLYLLSSLMTPYEFDVVEYHLQAPKEFAAAGVISFVPHNVYANMPLGAEMHSLAMMGLIGREVPDAWWWGGLIGKYIIGSFSLLAAALLGGFFNRHFGGFCGWSAAGLVLAVPGNLFVTNAGLIDSVVGAYLLAMLVIWSTPWPTNHMVACFGFTSLFAGAAAACKYPGFVFAVVPLALVAVGWMLRTGVSPRRQMQMVGSGMGAMFLTCLPWFIKNAIHAGNPFYPLAAGIMGGRGMDAQRIEQWQVAHAVPIADGSAYGMAALLKAVRQLSLDSPFLSPSLVAPAAGGLLIYLWFYLSNRSRANKGAAEKVGVGRLPVAESWSLPKWFFSWIGLAVWILGVWYCATHRIDRFWLPVAPILAGMAMFSIVFIARWLSVSLAAVVVMVSLGYGAFATASGALGDHRFFVSLEALRNDAGNEELPGRISPIALWLNQNMRSPTDRVLLVGEARVYDIVPAISYATCFNENPAELLLREKTVQEQRDNLRQVQATHLLIHWSEIARYRSPGNYGFSSWPQRSDIERLLADGIIERIDWPFHAEEAELFRFVEQIVGEQPPAVSGSGLGRP